MLTDSNDRPGYPEPTTMEPVAPPVAPPVHPGRYAPAPRPPVWPVVIGVISIVFGAVGILGGLGGLMGPLFMGFARAGPPEAQAGLAGIRQWLPWMIVSTLLNGAVAALLLAGGIGLVSRRPWSPRALVAWAIVRIPMVVFAGAVGYLVQDANFQAMQQQQSSTPAPPMPAGLMQGIVAGGVIFGILWGWAFPGFVLVWFSRPRIREQTGAWRAASPA